MSSTRIRSINARQILDIKGKPMLEVDVVTEGGILGRGASPSGVTAGIHEAFVLRDGDPKCFGGLSVYKAVDIVKETIAPALIGMDVMDQKAIDDKLIALDGTEGKTKLGGNTLFSTSLACIRAAATCKGVTLDEYFAGDKGIKTIALPTYGFICGGSYQKNTMPFQEITAIPYKVDSIMESVEIGVLMEKALFDLYMKEYGHRPAIVALCGWEAPDSDPMACFDLVYEAAKQVGVEKKIGFHIDCASSENYIPERGTYNFVSKEISRDEMIAYVKKLTEKYDFLYIEDILDQDDWEGWTKASAEITRTILIGDDFTVTNKKRLERAYNEKAAMGFIYKPNQVGTITECLDTYHYAQEHGMIAVPSPRAGGVFDDVVFDLAVGLECPAIKQGPPHGDAVYGLDYLMRAASLHPDAKPFDFTPFKKF